MTLNFVVRQILKNLNHDEPPERNPSLAGLDLGASFTNAPGGTANWIFTDTTGNYNDGSGSVEISIARRGITVTADDQTKAYGEVDPPLTYGITSGSLVPVDEFFGNLSREAGVNVGTYAISQGSLGLSDNYDLSFVDADLTITLAMLTGDATTQDALNMAKQGKLNITVSDIRRGKARLCSSDCPLTWNFARIAARGVAMRAGH